MTTVVKLGGNALIASANAHELISSLASDLLHLAAAGERVIVVHGGGPHINEVLEAYGASSVFLDGLRVTDELTMKAVTMGLSLVNTELCAGLSSGGIAALGMSGAIQGLLTSSPKGPQWGRVGVTPKVNAGLLEHFLSLGYVPVVSPLAVDSHGDFLNCNADAVAGAIAASMSASTLVLLSDVDQIRRDVNDPSTALLVVSVGEVRSLIESGAITGGMIPKIEAAVTAVEAGAARVIIANGSRSHGLRDAISGTVPQTEVVA